MDEQKFRCSDCGDDKVRVDFHEERRDDRKRAVTSRCRQCRSDAYFAERYPEICIQCLKHRPIDSNKICPRCNDERGFRQCRICGDLKLKFFEFYGTRRICKDCFRDLRSSRAAGAGD